MSRRTFRIVSTAFAAALLVAATVTASPAARETEQFDRTIAFRSGGTLSLKNFSGHVRITGTDGTDVVIHATRRAPRERLDHIKIDVQQDASEIRIEANKKDDQWRDRNNNVVETDFEIQVPRQTELDVHVFSSDVNVTGVSGRQNLHTFSGRVDVTGATGPLEAETFSGDVRVTLASAVNGEVDFDSFSGRLSSDQPIVIHTGGRHSRVRGTMGSGGDVQFRFKTFSGDVTLK